VGQATGLVQLGLLSEYVPFPHRMLDGREPAPGRRFEVRVPATGVETATKMLDKNWVISNEMLGYKVRDVSIIR